MQAAAETHAYANEQLCTAGAVTLEQAHMQPQAGPAGLQRAPAAEQQLWGYLTQIAMALRAAHLAGCAVGAAGLAPSKVLLTSRASARIKIGKSLHAHLVLRRHTLQQRAVHRLTSMAFLMPLIDGVHAYLLHGSILTGTAECYPSSTYAAQLAVSL